MLICGCAGLGCEGQRGRVLAWEPPTHFVLTWQNNAQWQYDPELVTEVEVRFSQDAGGTPVELEHRLDGYGEAAEQIRQIFDAPAAWEGTPERFAMEVGSDDEPHVDTPAASS